MFPFTKFPIRPTNVVFHGKRKILKRLMRTRSQQGSSITFLCNTEIRWSGGGTQKALSHAPGPAYLRAERKDIPSPPPHPRQPAETTAIEVRKNLMLLSFDWICRPKASSLNIYLKDNNMQYSNYCGFSTILFLPISFPLFCFVLLLFYSFKIKKTDDIRSYKNILPVIPQIEN